MVLVFEDGRGLEKNGKGGRRSNGIAEVVTMAHLWTRHNRDLHEAVGEDGRVNSFLPPTSNPVRHPQHPLRQHKTVFSAIHFVPAPTLRLGSSCASKRRAGLGQRLQLAKEVHNRKPGSKQCPFGGSAKTHTTNNIHNNQQ